MPYVLEDDLNHILALTPGLWEELREQRLFITGGTGFFGAWLLHSLLWANERYKLNVTACVLSRNPAAFRANSPQLANHPAIALHSGDVRSFEFPDGAFTHFIHAATDYAAPNAAAPLTLLDTIIEGTRHTLEFARHCGVKKFLLASSGAVYGRQPPDLTHILETYGGAPETTDAQASYGEGKRLAELLCCQYYRSYGIESTIARCFAFVGPYLPLAGPFAIGNFILDGINGNSIRVGGDGTPYRSYLYAADLAVWLWTLLLRGQPGRAYNVGSDEALTIRDLAQQVAGAFTPPAEVQIARQPVPGQAAARYVPSIERAAAELGLRPTIGLPAAIERTVQWARGG